MDYILTITKYILEGAMLTAKLWGITFGVSIVLAFFLAALYEQSKNRYLNYLIDLYTTVIRGTPLLLQLYFVYYGLPILADIKFEAFVAATICFIASWTAYLIEVFRGGIKSVDQGQYEAAYVLGLSKWQAVRNIILPQVLVAVIPSVANQSLSLVYGTALVSTIGLGDILKNAKVAVVRDFRLDAFVIAGAIYLAIGIIFIFTSRRFEKMFSKYKLNST